MWHNSWHPLGLLLLKYSQRLIYDTASSLQAKLSSVISGSSWSWPMARSNSLVEVQSYLFDIQPCQERSDVAVWSLGLFKVWAIPFWSYLAQLMAHSYPGMLQSGTKITPPSTPSLPGFQFSIDCQQKTGSPDGSLWRILAVFFVVPLSPETTYSLVALIHLRFGMNLVHLFLVLSPHHGLIFQLGGISHLVRNRKWMVHIKIVWNLYIYHIWKERNFRLKRGQFRCAASLSFLISEDLSFKLRSLGH